MARSFGNTSQEEVSLVADPAPTTRTIPGASVADVWWVIGSFFLPKSVQARMDAILSVSIGTLTVQVRLFDLEDNVVVSGSIASTSQLAPTRAQSGIIELTGGRNYQIQAQCYRIGATDSTYFGVIDTATISN